MSSFSPPPGLPSNTFIIPLTHPFEQQAQAVPIFVLTLKVKYVEIETHYKFE